MTQRILPEEDMAGKKTMLQDKTDEIAEHDQKFCKLAEKILVDEADGKGNIIQAIVEKAKDQLQQNQVLLQSIDEEFNRLIDSYDLQVDQMKIQDMTIYYKKLTLR
jgi:hypothetical protein